MASKPRLYPNRLTKDVSSDSTSLTCFAAVGGDKPNGQAVQHDKFHVSDSAFLAERGILTGTKVTRQSVASRQHVHAA